MPQTAHREDTAPARIGRYTVDAPVVSGTFARLFRARDPALDRQVAIKLFSLAPEQAAAICFDVAEWRRRFVVEARVMAALDHPHVVRVLDVGRHEGAPYMVMPYLAANLRREIGRDEGGPGLAPLERPRAMEPRRAATVLAELASALAAIHAAGLVHRDVKPTNLLLTRPQNGSVKLCDFGMAKVAGRAEPAEPVWFGSPDYMAPEQGRGAHFATDRSDVYAAGVLGWRLLLGRLPDGDISGLPPEAPDGLRRLLADATSVEPCRRPSAAEMVGRLAELDWG